MLRLARDAGESLFPYMYFVAVYIIHLATCFDVCPQDTLSSCLKQTFKFSHMGFYFTLFDDMVKNMYYLLLCVLCCDRMHSVYVQIVFLTI